MDTLRQKKTTNLRTMIIHIFKRIMASLILICWILLGLISAGYFCPLQLREYILINTSRSFSKSDVVEQVSEQIAELRNEVHELKAVTKTQIKTDRKEVIAIKDEAEIFAKDVLDEISQIKDIMQMLLELRRQERGLSPLSNN